MLRQRFRGDIFVDKSLSHLHHLRNQFEEARPKVENAPKVVTQPEVEVVPEGHHTEDGKPNASRVHHGIGRLEPLAQSLWKITMIGKTIMRRSPLIMQMSYHRNTTIVDIYFASKNVGSMDLDPNQSLWQSVRSTQVGTNGKPQLRQIYVCFMKESFLGQQSQNLQIHP